MIDYYDQSGPMYTWKKIETTLNAKECLKTISKKYPCYLATNSNDSTKEEINKALCIVGIDKFITDIFCSKDIGFEKPSIEFFKAILNRLNLNPNEIIFVGDDIKKDILGASRVGMIPIHYDPYSKNFFKGLKVRNLINLINILENIK